MLIVLNLLFLALCAAVLAPGTRIGKFIRDVLIDAPAYALKRKVLFKTIVGLIVFCVLTAIVIGAPEWIVAFGLTDLAYYLDIGVVLLLVSAVTYLKPSFARSTQTLRRIFAQAVSGSNRIRRFGRAIRARKPRVPPSDDGEIETPVWAFA